MELFFLWRCARIWSERVNDNQQDFHSNQHPGAGVCGHLWIYQRGHLQLANQQGESDKRHSRIQVMSKSKRSLSVFRVLLPQCKWRQNNAPCTLQKFELYCQCDKCVWRGGIFPLWHQWNGGRRRNMFLRFRWIWLHRYNRWGDNVSPLAVWLHIVWFIPVDEILWLINEWQTARLWGGFGVLLPMFVLSGKIL